MLAFTAVNNSCIIITPCWESSIIMAQYVNHYLVKWLKIPRFAKDGGISPKVVSRKNCIEKTTKHEFLMNEHVYYLILVFNKYGTIFIAIVLSVFRQKLEVSYDNMHLAMFLGPCCLYSNG